MAEGELGKRLLAALGGIRTVFALLVVITAILGITLIRIVPNLDGRWEDPRLWLSLLLLVGIVAIAGLVLWFMKKDQSLLLEPKVEDTKIEDSTTG